jgi:hypothetical protein
LEWLETIVIHGVQLEAFTTSGGLGTMCETYGGRVENLDYKTIRYPGHAKLMNFFFHELLMRKDRKKAGEILVHAKPPVTEDVVYVHASAEGWKGETLSRDEFVRAYYPVEIAGKMARHFLDHSRFGLRRGGDGERRVLARQGVSETGGDSSLPSS